MSPEEKTSFKSLFRELSPFFATTFLAFLISSSFIFGLTSVSNTGSMEPSYTGADIVFKNVLAVGGKTPDAIGIPFAKSKVLGMRTYLPDVYLPVFKVPGYAKLKRGNVVTFYTPEVSDRENIIPVQRRQEMIKRMVALAGDAIEIRNGRVWVYRDGSKIAGRDPNEKYRQYIHNVSLTQKLPNNFLQDNTIAWSQSSKTSKRYNYALTMTLAQTKSYKALLKQEGIDEFSSDGQKNTSGRWLVTASKYNDMEKLTVPSKGDKICLKKNGTTHPLYIKTLENIEPTFMHVVEGDSHYFYLNGRQINEYTCKEKFCFVMGDNFHGSYDSRGLGLLPRGHISSRVDTTILNMYSPLAWLTGFLACFLILLFFFWIDLREERKAKKKQGKVKITA